MGIIMPMFQVSYVCARRTNEMNSFYANIWFVCHRMPSYGNLTRMRVPPFISSESVSDRLFPNLSNKSCVRNDTNLLFSYPLRKTPGHCISAESQEPFSNFIAELRELAL